MESAFPGLVLDSSVLVAAERQKLTTPEAIGKVREAAGDITIVICPLTVAELAHGIYRADTPERSRMRRQFLDELKAHVPVHPITESTGEIIARIGANSATQWEPSIFATSDAFPAWPLSRSERSAFFPSEQHPAAVLECRRVWIIRGAAPPRPQPDCRASNAPQ